MLIEVIEAATLKLTLSLSVFCVRHSKTTSFMAEIQRKTLKFSVEFHFILLNSTARITASYKRQAEAIKALLNTTEWKCSAERLRCKVPVEL